MTPIELTELYNTNDRFKEYTDKYAKTHRLLPEYALKCIMVKQFAEWLKREGK